MWCCFLSWREQHEWIVVLEKVRTHRSMLLWVPFHKIKHFHIGHKANTLPNTNEMLLSQIFLLCSHFKGSNWIKYWFLPLTQVLIVEWSKNKNVLLREIWYGKENTSSVTKSFNFKSGSEKGNGVNTACSRIQGLQCSLSRDKGIAFPWEVRCQWKG